MCQFRMFDRINHNWGIFIATYPKWHIWGSFIAFILISLPLINLRIEHDIRASFSPLNSKATYEGEVYKEFYNLTKFPQRSFILFEAKDSGSMLRLNEISDVLALDQSFTSVLKTRDSMTGIRGCDPVCDLNVPFHLVSTELVKMYLNELIPQNDTAVTNNNNLADDSFLLDYPISIYQGNKLFTGMNMIGAQVSDEVFANNKSRLISVKRIILWYFSRADSIEVKKLLRKTSLDLFEKAKTGDLLKYVNFEIFGDEIANSEMVRGAIEATVLMSIGFLLLFIFVTLVIYRKMDEMSKYSVPAIVFASILCPFMASLAAFGLLSGLGFPSYTIMCVTPFLIAGVGVDDAFIMLQSWNQHRNIACMKKRLSLVMVHVGPSITITSLTNTVAFGIGYATPTPQVFALLFLNLLIKMSLFCLCTSIAVFFDYILTFTLLAPIVICVTPKEIPKSVEEANNHLMPATDDTISAKLQKNELNNTTSKMILKYAKFINTKTARLLAFLLLAIIYTITTMGVCRMRSTFEPSKAFPSDSPLATSLGGIRTVFNEFFPINIYVNRPPNISDEKDV